jgi:lipopolysaccharide assembly outer membrane protein LptD (OstA)
LTAGVASTFNLSNNQADPIIHAKYLTKIGVNDVNIEGGVRFGDHDDSYNLKGDYYLDRTLSIGATYDLNTEDHFDDSYAFGINARKFIAENISVQGGLSAGNDHNGDGTFGVNVGGTYRF